MKTNPSLVLSALLAFALLLSGCGKSQEEKDAETRAIADAAAKEAVAASNAENEKQLAKVQADSAAELAAATKAMEDKMAEEKAMLEKELKGQLAKQVADVRSEFETSNDALRSQLDSLTQKYNALKSKLPENVTESVSAKLPELKSSLSNLEGITDSFNPSSLEQLKEWQNKYQDELSAAKNIADEILKVLGKGSLNDLIPSL